MWEGMSGKLTAAPRLKACATDLPDPDAILGRVSASAKGLFTAEGALVAVLLPLVLGIVHAVFRA
jgi:hypothetical protein